MLLVTSDKTTPRLGIGFPSVKGHLSVAVIQYFTLHRLMPAVTFDSDLAKSEILSLNSHLVSIEIYTESQTQAPVRITLPHLQRGAVGISTCVFWSYTSAAWSAHGCRTVSSNATHTECMCTHLTTFALLLRQRTAQLLSSTSTSVELGIYVYIACSASALILAVSLFRMATQRAQYHHAHLVTRCSLAIALFFTSVLFMAGIEQTGSTCTGISIGVQYFLLSAACSLFLEIWQLSRSAALNMHKLSNLNVLTFVTISWGFPSVLVAVLIEVLFHQDLGKAAPCWIRSDDGAAFLLFCVPISGVLGICSLFLFIKPQFQQNKGASLHSEVSPWRYSRKSYALNFILLTVTWLLAAVMVEEGHQSWQILFSLANVISSAVFWCVYAMKGQRRESSEKAPRSRHGSLSMTSEPSMPPPDRAWTYDPFTGVQREFVTLATFNKTSTDGSPRLKEGVAGE